MNHSILKIVKWFCRQITFNELASAIIIFHEVLNNSRSDIPLKFSDKSPHYRDFRVDTIKPLPALKVEETADWQTLKAEKELLLGKSIKPIKNRNGKQLPPGLRCNHCDAPKHYLYINNGKLGTQVKCKICNKTGATDGAKRKRTTRYRCPHCKNALFKWKENKQSTIYKCPNKKCSHYLSGKKRLTKDETAMRDQQKYNPNFKLHYQYREYHIASSGLKSARPAYPTKIDIRKIHHSYYTLGLILTFSINLGLSSRITRDALKGIFDIHVSHQTVINYINATASFLSEYIDDHLPLPKATCSADETYIIVKGKWNYTWFIIDSKTRAICGYNLSQKRDMQPALALLHNTFRSPDGCKNPPDLVTDGNPSYDSAVMAFNDLADKDTNKLTKHTVIGLKNLDQESTDYRCFKQLVERLNRTYKYHTRPRAGFKTFEGAITLTTLFIAFYNFMRPHSTLENRPPVKLKALENTQLLPEKWVTLIEHAAA